jgi:hypothetical protein
LILDLEFDQHLGSHKHVINIIMWFRDMGCYRNTHRRHPNRPCGLCWWCCDGGFGMDGSALGLEIAV